MLTPTEVAAQINNLLLANNMLVSTVKQQDFKWAEPHLAFFVIHADEKHTHAEHLTGAKLGAVDNFSRGNL